MVVAVLSRMHLNTSREDFVVGTLLRCSHIDEEDLIIISNTAFWGEQFVGVAGKHVCSLEGRQKLFAHSEHCLLRPRFHLI